MIDKDTVVPSGNQPHVAFCEVLLFSDVLQPVFLS